MAHSGTFKIIRRDAKSDCIRDQTHPFINSQCICKFAMAGCCADCGGAASTVIVIVVFAAVGGAVAKQLFGV